MSRFSGAWVALKCIHDTVESTASIEVDPDRVAIAAARGFHHAARAALIIRDSARGALAAHGAGGRAAAARPQARSRQGLRPRQRARPHRPRRRGRRLGIVTTGKSWHGRGRRPRRARASTRPAPGRWASASTRSALTWPLEPRDAASRRWPALDQVMVIEEKRAADRRTDERAALRRPAPAADHRQARRAGAPLFPSYGQLDSNTIALAIARRLRRATAMMPELRAAPRRARGPGRGRRAIWRRRMVRLPWFCPGCPHNSSTKVPEGSRAVGRHRLPLHGDLDGPADPGLHPDGRGGRLLARHGALHRPAPHVFQNIGDGTFYHSGSLAIRAAKAVRRQHHLQDPLQRRRRHDRRPEDGDGQPHACRRSPACWRPRGSREIRGRHRRAGQVSDRRRLPARRARPPPRRAGQGPAPPARRPGRHRDHLRPDLRRREAPPPQARHLSRPGPSGWSSTSWSARAAATAACSPTASPSSRSRPSSAASGGSTSPPATRIFPASRASARSSSRSRAASSTEAASRRGRRLSRSCRSPSLPALDRALRHRRHRHRRHGRHHHRGPARHGGASRGQGLQRARHAGPGAEGRCRRLASQARPHRRRAPARPRIAAGTARLLLGCDMVVAAGKKRAPDRGPGPDPRGPQSRGDHDRRLHPRSRPRLPGRADSSARSPAPPARGRSTELDASRLAPPAPGRRHRRQPPHGRLRLAEGPAAALARGHRARDRDQRRRRRLQPQAFLWGRRAAARPAAVEAVARAGEAAQAAHRARSTS